MAHLRISFDVNAMNNEWKTPPTARVASGAVAERANVFALESTRNEVKQQ